MKSLLQYIFKLILKALLPAFLVYFYKDDFISSFLIEKGFLVTSENVSIFKFWAFLLGTVIAFIILPIEIYYLKKKIKKQSKILKNQVNVILAQISSDLKFRSGTLYIRVFKAKKSFFSNKVKLFNYNIENITNDVNGKKNLVFEVDSAVVQGVVGRAYVEKSFFVDYNISNEDNSYQLTPELLNRIGDVQFCCAAPIVFDKEKIKYIVSIDSNELIHKSATNTALLKRNLVYLCQLFDEFIL
ncbi:hypothetical protein SAMN04487762_1967 [Polaribacter sp. Hel1_33_78]|uniref:hypothetical protein n=1 Tax=Polaribacter sp. Hel1_33_78 TaxID=1336804 RepID=UPI00087DEF57|nr:hypothetical protein [Polaribacter sp. Hel1_33_78]SDU12845.1 hypothetical protein SAMN04487762_1967 [Polaribacter sp. Hel1_33_78]